MDLCSARPPEGSKSVSLAYWTARSVGSKGNNQREKDFRRSWMTCLPTEDHCATVFPVLCWPSAVMKTMYCQTPGSVRGNWSSKLHPSSRTRGNWLSSAVIGHASNVANKPTASAAESGLSVPVVRRSAPTPATSLRTAEAQMEIASSSQASGHWQLCVRLVQQVSRRFPEEEMPPGTEAKVAECWEKKFGVDRCMVALAGRDCLDYSLTCGRSAAPGGKQSQEIPAAVHTVAVENKQKRGYTERNKISWGMLNALIQEENVCWLWYCASWKAWSGNKKRSVDL